NRDGTSGVVDAALAGRQLKLDVLERDGVVGGHDAVVLLGEDEVEVESSDGQESALGLGRRDGEAAVEVLDELALEVKVGRVVVANASEAQLLGEAALERAERPLAPSASLRRTSEDLADPHRLQST